MRCCAACASNLSCINLRLLLNPLSVASRSSCSLSGRICCFAASCVVALLGEEGGVDDTECELDSRLLGEFGGELSGVILGEPWL